jgi:hypothetical protein
MHERERREESVHAFEERDAFQHRTPEYFEWAPSIVDAVMGKEIPHTIGDSGGHSLYQAILSLLSPSAHKIIGGSIGQELQDVFTVLLKIAVEFDDELAGRLRKTRVERAGFAVISVEMEHPYLRVLNSQTVQVFTAAVAAAIVYEENLIGPQP